MNAGLLGHAEVPFLRWFRGWQNACGRERGEVFGGERHDFGDESAFYVAPAVVRMPSQTTVVHSETFAPILYVLTYDDLDEPVSWDYGDWHWPEVGVELATTDGPVLRHLGLQGDAF